MRVSDSLLSNNFITGLNAKRSKIEQLRKQIANSVKVQKPSDSPDGAVKILRLNDQLSQSAAFKSNVENSLSYMKETIFSMESIQTEVEKIMVELTNARNPSIGADLTGVAQQIDLALTSILNSANSEFNGKYLFGGTDFSSNPYGFSADNSVVEVKVNSTNGISKVKVSTHINQKINVTGTELFSTVLKTNGNFNTADAIGTATNQSQTIFDSKGNQYTYNSTYTKTANNTYALTYDILDSTNTSVFAAPQAAKQLAFNASGYLESIDGSSPDLINIKVPAKNIDFNLDLNGVQEKASATSLNTVANQQMDIFNTLVSIRDNLKLGILPNSQQEKFISDFNKKMLNKIAETGDVQNQLSDTVELINNQEMVLEELLSKEQDVDVAKAVLDLQNQDYLLQVTYKLSSMILPKSLLDYL